MRGSTERRALAIPLLVLAVGVVSALGPAPADGQSSAEIAAGLRVDVDQPPRRPIVTGYVYNDSRYRIANVRLRVDGTDASGRPLPPTFGWVDGDVPARGRARFRIAGDRNAATRTVSVDSFDLVSAEEAP